MNVALQILGAAAIVASLWAAPARAAESPRPNILFIAIDDLNDWVGCLQGHPQVQTPHIDALAARGTLFTNAHCQSPLCNPSRTSLLTGLRPSTTGIYALAPWFRDLPQWQEVLTLPKALEQSGYRTLSTGKIYHGKSREGEFQQLGPAISVGARPPQKLVQTPSPNPLMDWGTFPHSDRDKGDWEVATWAVDQLSSRPAEPFLLAVGFFLPHVPCYATQRWFDLYPAASLALPPMRLDDRDDTPRFSWYLHWRLPEPRYRFLDETDQWRNLVRSYLACVSFVDHQVGRLLQALEEQELAGNTLVVLWSDHGYHLGEKLITGKNTLWERSTRVPLIFAGPGVAPHARCGRPVELLDIFPTLVELCDLPGVPHLEGHSLVRQLRDPAAPRPWPAITTHNHDNHAVRTERWRYIRYADGSQELYDTQHDPHEWTNVAALAENSAIVDRLRGWLPRENARPAPGSQHRILRYERGRANWQGQDIDPGEPVPEL